MKLLKNEIVRVVTVAVFTIALCLPVAVKLAHSFENHQHEICTERSVHIHTQQLDCSICDFHFSIFNFKPQPFPELTVTNEFQKSEFVYLFEIFNKKASPFYLRGPPLLS